MAQQVWQALNSLSQTMRDRGGIADAQIRGIDATTGLKRAEYEIGRGIKADERADAAGLRAERGLALQEAQAGRLAPVQQLAADEALDITKKKNTLIPVTQSLYMTNDPYQNLAMATEDKKGNTTASFFLKMFPGSTVDDKGNVFKKDGTPATISQYDWETKYKPAVMFTHIMRNDPDKYLAGKAWELGQQLSAESELSPGSPEHAEAKKQLEDLEAIRGDKSQMAMLYGKQSMAGHEALIWAKTNNASPDFVRMIEGEVSRSEARFAKYKGEIKTPEQKLAYEKAEADLEKIRAETKKIIKDTGKSKELTVTQKIAQQKQDIKNFSDRYRVIKDTLSGFTTSPNYTESQRKAIEKAAERKGLGVGFDEVITKGETRIFDKDDPDTKTYIINSVWGEDDNAGRQGIGQSGTVAPTAEIAPPPGFIKDQQGGSQPVAQPVAAQPQTIGIGNRQAPPIQPASVQPEPQIDTTAGLGFEAVQPAQPSPELIPGMGGNIAAFKRSAGEAARVLVDFARAMGFQTKEQAAQQLADFTGVPVENINSMPPNKLAELANAVIASQAEAQKGLGNIQPYGIR